MDCFNDPRNRLAVLLLGTMALGAAGCDKLPWKLKGEPVSETSAASSANPLAAKLNDPGVLALVNGTPVKQDAFQRRIDAMPEDSPAGFATTFGTLRIVNRKPRTTEEKKILLEEMVKEELIVQDAVALGLERDLKIKGQLDDARRAILMAAVSKREADKASIDEKEIEDHYERFKEVYKEPERIHLAQIVSSTLEDAEALRTHAVQGEDFAQLAATRSKGPGKETGGDVGWFLKALDHQILTQTGQNPSEKILLSQFESVAFTLEQNQVSQPVKGPDGYYIFKLLDRKAQSMPALSELHDRLREGLLVQKRQKQIQEHVDRLSAKGNVQLNENRLE